MIFSLAAAVSADDWGEWDDLPDNLLTPERSSLSAIDQLYSRLSTADLSNQQDLIAAINQWISELDLSFADDDSFMDLIEDLEGESDEEIMEELQEWLDEQSDDAADELEDYLDDLEDAEEDRLKEEEDALDEEPTS